MPDLTLLSSIDKQKESLGVTIEKEPVSVKRSVRKLFEFLVRHGQYSGGTTWVNPLWCQLATRPGSPVLIYFW